MNNIRPQYNFRKVKDKNSRLALVQKTIIDRVLN
jgi:hypothetical protein